MKQICIDAIRSALTELLAQLQTKPIPQEGHWVYRRGTSGGWQGSFVARPGTFSLFEPHEPLIDVLSDRLSAVLSVDYSEYMNKLVGVPGGAMGILQPRMIIVHLAHEILMRYGTFAVTDQQLDQLFNEAAAFFDRRTIRLQLTAPVLNAHGPREMPPIRFPGGIIMRPLTDEEFTKIYGGNPIFQGTSRMLSFPDFVFVKNIEIAKVLGEPMEEAEPFSKPTQDMLDRCILALSTFKDAGPIGYDGLRVTPAELAFGAGFATQQLWGNEHVPLGHYKIEPDEATAIEEHAQRFQNIHPTLEMACQRLVDATRRTKPRDSIVDAAIGLESLLLSDVEEEQRGETRFRFSLNYASLFRADQRRAAFNTARDLYDLRSKIAHGGQPDARHKINGTWMVPHEIAVLARSVLRETLAKFMPNSSKPEFLTRGYWITRTLGL